MFRRWPCQTCSVTCTSVFSSFNDPHKFLTTLEFPTKGALVCAAGYCRRFLPFPFAVFYLCWIFFFIHVFNLSSFRNFVPVSLLLLSFAFGRLCFFPFFFFYLPLLCDLFFFTLYFCFLARAGVVLTCCLIDYMLIAFLPPTVDFEMNNFFSPPDITF